MSRFGYIKYDQKAQNMQQELKEKFEGIEQYVETFLPNSRAKSLLLTALEETYMWSGKAIRDDQLSRTAERPALEQVERG